MSAQTELLQSFEMLTDGIKALSINNSIKKAQDKVDELNKNSELTQFERIRQQQAIAQQVGASITGQGGSAAQAQAAMASLAPNIPDARMAALEATGKGSIEEAQKALQDEEDKRQFDKEKRAYQRQKMLQDDQQEAALELALLKANSKGASKPVPPAVSNKLSELKDNLDQLKHLREGFDANKGAIGPVDKFKTDKLPSLGGLNPYALTTEEAVYRKDAEDFFNQYRKVITGAAASMPELKGLLKAIPTSADRQDVYAGSLDMHIKKVESALSNRLKLLKAQGRDVADLEEALGLAPAGVDPYGGASSLPSSTPPAPSGQPAGTNISNYIKFAP